jgi:hypothetical protein
MNFKVKTQMKDRSPILHTPPCNTATCVKTLLWSKIAYKRNSVYRVRVKRGLSVFPYQAPERPAHETLICCAGLHNNKFEGIEHSLYIVLLLNTHYI